ncbi:MAG: GspH/FimT family pseudopilin [Rhodocyclaceae bacterium]|nr:GspH/FimT family pseudopilin [Rhodocyclaceae bacterium]
MDRQTPRRQVGFTLIELMVTLAVFAVVAALTVPGMNGFIVSSRLTGQANELLAGLNLARAEAISRNQRVILCPVAAANGVPDTSGCVNPGTGNWAGWMVFVDVNRNGAFDAGEVIARAGVVGGGSTTVKASASLSGVSNIVDFRPDGVARAHGTVNVQQVALGLCDTSRVAGENARLVTVMLGSRMSVARQSASNCNPPSNP